MQVRGFLNYRLKYCWAKVICCVCQPNELKLKNKKKLGGLNMGPTKNLGGHGSLSPPLESPLAKVSKLQMLTTGDL